jgi:hypothetical protein
MRICDGHLSTRSRRRNDLAVASHTYVPNLAGQLHRAAIPEARRPQRLSHTDLYAAASALDVPYFSSSLKGAVKASRTRDDSG